MQIDLERIAHWRKRAEQYRNCAEARVSPGAQRAYHALAKCADSVADRMERDVPAGCALVTRYRRALAIGDAAAHRRRNESVN